MSKKKKKKPTTIGEMCGSRGTWGAIKPITRVVKDKTKYTRKKKHKKGGEY